MVDGEGSQAVGEQGMKTGGGALRGVATAGSTPGAVSRIRIAEALSADLAVGQVVRGTVRWTSADGQVGLDLLGRRVRAVTELPLGAGTTYEFTVVERGPRVVLTPTRLLPLPPRAEAMSGGWLGPAGDKLASAVGGALPGLSAGRVTAMELADLIGRLGELRDLDSVGLAEENVRRSESSVPRVVPLPIEPGGWLRDGRLFLLAGEEKSASSRSGRGPFTVVLLLELSALGALRIDVELRDRSVHLRFIAERSGTIDAVRAAESSLREGLDDDGLVVSGIAFRHAGPSGLPVADLVAPPVERDAATVDVHV